MTARDREKVRQAQHRRKVADLEAQGGWRRVEADAAGHDRALRRRAAAHAQNEAKKRALSRDNGTHVPDTRIRLEPCDYEAVIRELHGKLEREHARSERLAQALRVARRERDMWYTRATTNPPDKGRGAAKKKLRRVA